MARREPDTDDDAPWLSSVEAERDTTTFVPQRRLIVGIAVFLLLLAIIVGGIWWVTERSRQGGSSIAVATPADAPLIPADPGPYKVPPGADDPTGLKVDGAGDTIYAAGEGETVTGALDPNAMPEDPLPRPGSGPAELLPTVGASETVAIPPAGVKMAAPKPAAPAPAAPKPVAPALVAPKADVAVAAAPLKPLPKPVAATPDAKPVKATGSAALQLGAFSTSAAADSVWSDYAKRFRYLGGLGKSVQKVERGDKTLYRLRATGVADRAAAVDLCSRLKIAGVECVVAS